MGLRSAGRRPLLYWWLRGYRADAYLLLGLTLWSPIAGFVLLVNSVFCLRRYHSRRHSITSAFFAVLSVAGVVALFITLPGFRM